MTVTTTIRPIVSSGGTPAPLSATHGVIAT